MSSKFSIGINPRYATCPEYTASSLATLRHFKNGSTSDCLPHFGLDAIRTNYQICFFFGAISEYSSPATPSFFDSHQLLPSVQSFLRERGEKHVQEVRAVNSP